ncbi:MAG TPA: S49 family peptidase [Mucilaginibacter sp.]|jgi:ClpP class serine protease
MNINKLASAISRGKWLIEPRTALVERQRAMRFLSRDFTASGDEVETAEIEQPYVITAKTYSKVVIDDWSGEIVGLDTTGNVCVIPIAGTIMKYDYCGSPGTDTLGAWVKAANQSTQIEAIVLLINSGGGSVEGTGEFADLVKSSEKPIMAFCDGMIASAAYWIGSSAKEVWVSHATAEIGSIGVAANFYDDSKAMEEYGYVEHYVNADSSPQKNMDFLNAMEGDYSGLKINSLNPLDTIFMSSVIANRDGKLKLTDITIGEKTYQEPLAGQVYLAQNAIENGLIDGICTLEQVIDKAIELSQSKLTNQNTDKLNSNQMSTKAEDKKEEQTKKSTSLLEKLQNALASVFGAESMDDDDKKCDDDDADAAKKSPEDDDADAKKKQDDPEAKKADDEDNTDDQDDDEDDEMEINGKTFSMKDPKQARAAIMELGGMLVEANNTIKANVEAMKQSNEEIKNEIKSSFIPEGSKRSGKTVREKSPLVGEMGSIAKAAVQRSVANPENKHRL